MIFNRKRRKKDKYDVPKNEYLVNNNRTEKNKPLSLEHYVVDQCEQIIEVSKELEDIREEYRIVSSYLNDIQIIERIDSEEKEEISETAKNIIQLNHVKEEFIKKEQGISEATFALMESTESEIPGAIKRLQENESYLDAIKRDLSYLEGEKIEWDYLRNYCHKKQKRLKNLSYFLLILFLCIMILLFAIKFMTNIDVQIWQIIATFTGTISLAAVLLSYQECGTKIRKAEISRNYLVSVENRIKIKFVTIKNAVDYACEKFHVKNSYEFIYNWEKYNELVKKREKQRQTNEDIDYFNKKLVRQLREYGLYDPIIWINYTHALLDRKEMVEVKHNLIVRRQKLRLRMEYNLSVISDMRKEIESNSALMGEKAKQIQEILNRLDKINGV